MTINGVAKVPVVPNPAKACLARNELFSSMSIKLCPSVEIVGIAKAAGYEAILIDLEHNPFSLSTVNQLSCAALAHGITSLVRVPANDSSWISRALDGGATGVIVPHVESAKEAEHAVKYARFAPLGERSATAGLPHLGYGHYSPAIANKACNDGTLVIVMVESQAGLDAVDEIAAVPGVDVVLIGGNDLTSALGVPGEYAHPLITSAVSRVIAATKATGIHAGIGGMNSQLDVVERYVAEGARFVMAGTDLPFLLAAASKRGLEMRQMKERQLDRDL